jgi:hypothetical protein
MTTNQTFQRTLGQTLGDAVQICQLTSADTTNSSGLYLSVVQSSGLDRNYSVNVPPNSTGAGLFKRLVPTDKPETFVNQNHWAVDLSSEIASNLHTITLRLVRTKAGTPPATTTLKCKVVAYPRVGQTLSIVDAQTTSTNATNVGIYDGALITPMDGKVGINTDSPSYELDVVGTVNTSTAYKIAGNDVLTATALGNNIISSNLTTLGTLSALNVNGPATVAGNLIVDTGTLAVDAVANLVNVVNLGVSGNLDVSSSNVNLTGLAVASSSNVVFTDPTTGRLTRSPLNSSLTYDIQTRSTSASSTSTAIVTYLTSGTLAEGTWAIWASGKYSTAAATRIINIYLRNDVSVVNVNVKSLQPWTNGSTYTFNYSLLGVTTLSSSGTVSIRFASGGSYTTNLYNGDLLCIRV